MPVTVQCREFPLTGEEVKGLWLKTAKLRQHPDEVITVRCVDEQEMRRLNKQYRGKDKVTNVLTFSYDGEHDVALCLPKTNEREYVAWLLVHAFLHVTGLNHEESDSEEVATRKAENDILAAAGFTMDTL